MISSYLWNEKETTAPTRWLAGEHLFWPRQKWQALQLAELALHLKHAATTALYHNRLPTDATITLETLRRLPTTSKDDLARAGSSAFGCPTTGVREWVSTSGTSGKPQQVPLTSHDLNRLAANEAVAINVAGIAPGDTVLLAVGMDRLFVAGLAYWLGAQKVGAACIRAGPQHASSAILLAEMCAQYHPSHIITVPSFLAATTADQQTVLKPHLQSLRAILCIGEPIRAPDGQLSPLGHRLHDRFLCPILSTYASTETCATFAESPLCRGGHLNPQLACIEILNENDEPLPPGETGEVVITPLGMQGLPLVRFRTGDVATLHDAPCPCGRTTPRLGPILGRRQQLLKVRGTSIYPPAILETLTAVPEVEDCVIVATHDHVLSDHLTLHLLLRNDTPTIRHAVESRLRAVLRVLPDMVYADRQTIRTLQFSNGSRKPQHFLDRRPR